MEQRNFTPNIRVLLTDTSQALGPLVCREDVLYDLSVIARIQRKNKDSAAILKTDFIRRYRALGVENPRELLADPAAVKALCSRQEVFSQLLETFHTVYGALPAPDAILHRHLEVLAPECLNSGESMALSLLRLFVEKLGFSCQAFPMEDVQSFCKKQLKPQEKTAFDSLPEREKKSRAQALLQESIFDKLKTAMPRQEHFSACRLRLLLKQFDRFAQQNPPSIPDLCKNSETALQSAGASGESHLQLLESALSLPEETLTPLLEETILKDPDLKRQMRKLCFTSKSGKSMSLREGYDQDYRAFKKELNGLKNQPTISLCWNLANGRMKNSGKCKEQLYQFAILAGMSWQSPTGLQPMHSVQKFLSDYSSSLLKSCSLSQVPDFMPDEKNYWEALYLYALVLPHAFATPAQALDSTRDRILFCAKNGNTPDFSSSDSQQNTAFFRFRIEELCLLQTKEDVCDYVRKHFPIPKMAGQNAEPAYAEYHLPRRTGNEVFRALETDTDSAIGSTFAGKILNRLAVPPEEESFGHFNWNQLLQNFQEKYPQKDDQEFLAFVQKLTRSLQAAPESAPSYEQRNLMLELLCKLAIQPEKGISLKDFSVYKEYYHYRDGFRGIYDLCALLQNAGFPLGACQTITDNQNDQDDPNKIVYILNEAEFQKDSPAYALWQNIQKKAGTHLAAFRKAAKAGDDHHMGDRPRFYPFTGEKLTEEALSAKLDKLSKEDEFSPIYDLFKLNEELLSVLPAPKTCRLTRAQVMAGAVDYFVFSQLPEERGAENKSCVELYDSFRRMADKLLAKARFSPIDEKNALDCYCRLALYQYLIETT